MDVQALADETLGEALADVANAMGWDNWPNDHDDAFEIRCAPCAEGINS